MGTFFYGSARTRVAIEDRTLAHLMAVTVGKLRRRESFLLSWVDEVKIGDGRSSVWLHDASDLHFKYAGKTSPELDRQLLEQMARDASSARGLDLGTSASLDAPPR